VLLSRAVFWLSSRALGEAVLGSERTAVPAAGSPVPWLLLPRFPMEGRASLVLLPGMPQPVLPAPAGARSSCAAASAEGSALPALLPPPLPNLRARGPARVSINLWLTCSCVLLWDTPWGGGIWLSSAEQDQLASCCSRSVLLFPVVAATGWLGSRTDPYKALPEAGPSGGAQHPFLPLLLARRCLETAAIVPCHLLRKGPLRSHCWRLFMVSLGPLAPCVPPPRAPCRHLRTFLSNMA